MLRSEIGMWGSGRGDDGGGYRTPTGHIPGPPRGKHASAGLSTAVVTRRSGIVEPRPAVQGCGKGGPGWADDITVAGGGLVLQEVAG